MAAISWCIRFSLWSVMSLNTSCFYFWSFGPWSLFRSSPCLLLGRCCVLFPFLFSFLFWHEVEGAGLVISSHTSRQQPATEGSQGSTWKDHGGKSPAGILSSWPQLSQPSTWIHNLLLLLSFLWDFHKLCFDHTHPSISSTFSQVTPISYSPNFVSLHLVKPTLSAVSVRLGERSFPGMADLPGLTLLKKTNSLPPGSY